MLFFKDFNLVSCSKSIFFHTTLCLSIVMIHALVRFVSKEFMGPDNREPELKAALHMFEKMCSSF